MNLHHNVLFPITGKNEELKALTTTEALKRLHDDIKQLVDAEELDEKSSSFRFDGKLMLEY